MVPSRSSLPSVIIAVLTLCLSTLCLAQTQTSTATATPAHNQVVIVHVKPDMQNEWFDLQKNELVPALKKLGLPSLTTYQTLLGNASEYVIVIPFNKFAVFDGEPPLDRALGAQGAQRL